MKSIFLLVSLLAISSNSLASEAPVNGVEPTANHGIAPQAHTGFSWGLGAKLNGSKLNGIKDGMTTERITELNAPIRIIPLAIALRPVTSLSTSASRACRSET